MQELMEIFLKRFLETTTKRSKNISVERKKDVHQPLKTTTTEEEEEEEEENDRENDARDGCEWKSAF